MNWIRNKWLDLVVWVINRYDGAVFSTDRTWRSNPVQSAREDITRATRETLQGKARDFERNSDLFNKLADLWEQYTVGTGLQFYATTTNPVWNTLADATWERWKPFADISSLFGFDNLQGVIARSWFVDGEVFVILTRGDGGRPRIQILEGHLCKTPESLKEQEGKTIVDGIQVDKNGRPVKYWFEIDKEKPVAFPAFSVVHIFEPSRPGQMRGIPYVTCSANTLEDLADLQKLEMGAAKLAAEIGNVETNASGELDALAARRQRLNITSQNSTGQNITRSTDQFYSVSLGTRNIALKTGDSIKNFQVERPSIATREFWRKLEEKVCAGCGIPLVLVYPDSMQGTVYRGSVDSAAAFFRCKCAVLAGHFKRIREYVLNAEGAFFQDLGNRPNDWQSVDYLPPAAPNTDIGYNSQAAIAELEAGLKSWDDILLPQGRRAEPILRRKAILASLVHKLATEFKLDPSEISTTIIDRPERIETQQHEAESSGDYPITEET
jgi:capsid protein